MKASASAQRDPGRDPHPIDGEVFHAGERALQAHFGVRERVAVNGVRAIRPEISEAHRDFLRTLRYLLVAGYDPSGELHVSMLFGAPGFVEVLDERHVTLHAVPPADDPIAAALVPGHPVGILGIQLEARRRVRLNVRLLAQDATGLQFVSDQSYNNCPQYIWPREWGSGPTQVVTGAEIGAAMPSPLDAGDVRDSLSRADTFFIASRHCGDATDVANGAARDSVDVSHRGGRPGFLSIEGDTLVWPEYAGNSYFNTLGNLLLEPRCALLVPDFATGDLLHLSGTAEIVLDDTHVGDIDVGLHVNCRVRFRATRILRRLHALRGDWPLRDRAENKHGPL